MVRLIRTIVPVLAVLAATAACSSGDGGSEQRLTEQRESYCTQLGAWQEVRDEAVDAEDSGAEADGASGYDMVGAVADDAFLAMEPLRDEPVGEGRTLAEATVAAMKSNDRPALSLVTQYCLDNGFETQLG
ncbi:MULTISPECIES: hypothetical protein [unclassified Streptomyces]|uniref:hypothetical protein n=1 Tax=unclassified Streptomyces TaxID=2593676 RepID=UPI002555548E|nr:MULTISPECIES: hypothetical protein [unclassified Streptomyces]WRZ66892.1 hypothetical protein OG408_24785 [Streptomyces sp. NBC_01257]WSU60901.1 hypothetical protein OG450_25045 [Streptomyces sp. NBC_01104]